MSRSPIEVEWARASFVDTDSEAHRVIHEGVRYIDRNNEMPSTIIPPQASINDLIHPTDYISYDSKSIEWKTSDLFSGRMSTYEGKTFSVLLPIKVGKITKQDLSDWPLTVDEAILACYDNKGSIAVFLIAAEKVFALNGYAVDVRIDKQPANPSVTELILPEKN